MEFKHLTPPEVQYLNNLVTDKQITQRHLPFGGSIFWDSMGVWRDPKTDKFYPDSQESLRRFSSTLRRNNLMFGVATNGPAIEGVDILKSLEYPVPSAVAVTEGGGIAILAFPSDGMLMPKLVASEKQLAKLAILEAESKKDPLMKALLEDEELDDAPPIRTPYGYRYRNPIGEEGYIPATNIVLTVPPNFEVLERRLGQKGINLADKIPGYNPSNYIASVLGYAREQFQSILNKPELELDQALDILIKEQNRRIYVTTKYSGLTSIDLNKSGGAIDSSRAPYKVGGLAVYRDYPEYVLEDSIYVADKALVPSKFEGYLTINPSERSMIVDRKILPAQAHRFVNFLRPRPIYRVKEGIIGFAPDLPKEAWEVDPNAISALVSCRLAVDITLDNSPPTFMKVAGVPFLRIGTASKAAEALTMLYEKQYGEAA